MKKISEDLQLNRRSFIKSAGMGVAAATSLFHAVKVSSQTTGNVSGSAENIFSSQASRESEQFWMDVRREFVFEDGLSYMNTGTTGSLPARVRQKYYENLEVVTKNPRESFGGVTRMREQLAPQFGCTPDEFVISGNTTDGMNMTLHGLLWDREDAIITTNHEHPGGIAPMSVIADRYGVGIYEVILPVGGNESSEHYVDLFRRKIQEARRDGRKPKIIVFSSPTYVTGTMLPIRALADLAISEGLYTLCDSAHGTGMIDFNFHELGIDFVAASGHKWQCGPGGTGVWYVRNRVDEYNPLPLPNFYPVRGSSYRAGNFSGDPRGTGGSRNYDVASMNQPGGNPNYPQLLAFVDVCNLWSQIGRSAIESRIFSMSEYARARVISEWGSNALICSNNPELASGLTSFIPSGAFDPTDADASSAFIDRLRTEYGFVIRNTSVAMPDGSTNIRPLRISNHIFHNQMDIERCFDAIVDLTNKIA